MRLSRVAMMAGIVCAVSGAVWAQDIGNPAVVESVTGATPQPDGHSFLLNLTLKGGQRLALQVPSTEALKIVDGLSKSKEQIAAVVQSIDVQAEKQGRFVVLLPHSTKGPLEPLALPVNGGEQFIQIFQQKLADAKASANH